MVWDTKIGNVVKQPLRFTGNFLVNGMHAQQDIPAQHRLLAAGGMAAGWWTLDEMRDIMFGLTQVSEGEYKEIKREEVAEPLRFLHKTIDWNPHSDSPQDQWKKLLYQMMPFLGAGFGTVAGSMFAFERSGRAQTFVAHKGAKLLNALDGDMAAQYAMSRPLRILTAMLGGFSAASGLTFLYGMSLNLAFASANGARVFAGSLAKGNMAPAKALDAQLGNLSGYVKAATRSNHQINDTWATQFVDRVLEPLFESELKTPEAREKARATIQKSVEEAYKRFDRAGRTPEEVAKDVTEEVKKLYNKNNIGVTLQRDFGLNPANAKLGNGNKAVSHFHDFLSSLGLARSNQTFTDKVALHTQQHSASAGASL